MQVGKFWLITTRTLKGPWHVGETDDKYWYIVNEKTGKSKKIGPMRLKGTNYFDRALAEAKRRNGEE